jgi:hypothetical protein
MDNLFKAQVRFNGGNPHLFKVRVDVTLKDLKDQLNEINQGLNPKDTRRVEDLQYACPGYLQTEKIMLTDDDCVRSMFSRYYQERMFPRIEMEVTLLRSPDDILNSMIMPENYVYVVSLLCSVFLLLEFQFNSCSFAQNVGIEVSSTGRDLQASLKSQRMKRTQHVFYKSTLYVFTSNSFV